MGLTLRRYRVVPSHLTHRPIPTCLRNHALINEVNAGRGPIHMVTMRAFQDPHLEEVGWENFLGMTIGQAVLWAATDVDPKNENPELTTSEPYVMGSHAPCSGAWCSGPEDLSPPEYFWGYNRMTTIEGLFGAGDAVGGTPHAFSSGSFTEGRLAAKAACPVVPVVILGSERLYNRRNWLSWRRAKVYIAIGDPIFPAEGGRKQLRDDTAAALIHLKDRLVETCQLTADDLPHSPQERMREP